MAPKIVTVEDSLAQFADGKRGAMPVNQTAYELTKKTLLTYLNNPQVARKDKQELITKVNDLPKAYNDNAKAALTAVLSQIATGKSQGPAPIVEQPAQKPGEEKKQEKPSWIWKYAPYAIGFVPVIGIPLAAGYGVYANVVTPYFKNREEEKKALQPPTTAEDASARATRVMATLAMMKSSPETKLGDWSKNIDQMLAQLKMCNEFYKDNRLSGTILTLENLQKKAADKNIGKTPIGMLTATVEQKMINDALKSLLANVKVMAPTTQKEANDKMQAVFNSLSQMQKADKSRFGVWEPTVDYAVKELNGCLQGGFFQGEYKTKIEHAIKQLQALQVKMGETYTDTKTSKKVALGSMPMNALSETVERSWLALAVNDVQKTIGWASAKPVAPIGETPKEKPGAPGVTRKPALKMNLYRLDDFLTQAQKDEMKKPENALAKQFYDGFAKDLGVIGDTRNLIMQIGFVAYVNRCYKAAENIAGGKAKEKEIQEMAVWIYHRGEGAGGAIVKHALEARDADAATLKPGKNTLPWQMYVPQQGNIVLEKGKYVLKEDVAEKYIKGVQYRLNAKDSETYMLGFVTARAGKPEIKGAQPVTQTELAPEKPVPITLPRQEAVRSLDDALRKGPFAIADETKVRQEIINASQSDKAVLGQMANEYKNRDDNARTLVQNLKDENARALRKDYGVTKSQVVAQLEKVKASEQTKNFVLALYDQAMLDAKTVKRNGADGSPGLRGGDFYGRLESYYGNFKSIRAISTTYATEGVPKGGEAVPATPGPATTTPGIRPAETPAPAGGAAAPAPATAGPTPIVTVEVTAADCTAAGVPATALSNADQKAGLGIAKGFGLLGEINAIESEGSRGDCLVGLAIQSLILGPNMRKADAEVVIKPFREAAGATGGTTGYEPPEGGVE